jgi:predicted MPP superfamily phosphohydrolase
MFQDDGVPIIVSLPKGEDYVDIYFVHDLHYGSEQFDEKKWAELKKRILSCANSRVCWVGDIFENAIPQSKGDVFLQKHSPSEQKEWITQQLKDLREKTIAVVCGNHEYNRTTKVCGLYPLYDCCLIAGVDDKYRNTVAFIDIGVGTVAKDKSKQVHYFGQIQHKAKDIKAVHSSDYTDGIDFFANGHDHETKDKPRAKLVFDAHNKVIYKRNIECLNCGSFCSYGGYGAREAYRPQSDKMYVLRLFGGQKKMETVGFYL